MRVVIGGVPRAGKTRLSGYYSGTVLHTDDLIGRLDWSAASEEVSRWMERPGTWCIEGVAAIRGIRKFLERNHGKPCDQLIWLARPFVSLTIGQSTMAQGCQTVFDGVADSLRARGVKVDVR